jgi:hypothetical protein
MIQVFGGSTMRRAFEAIGLALSIVGLLFAFDQFFASRQQLRTLHTLGNEVELATEGAHAAADAASTRYIADFPYNLPTVTEVVQGTCENLDIMSDVAGYGQFSAQDSFLKYLHEIEAVSTTTLDVSRKGKNCAGRTPSKSKGSDTIGVRMLVYDPVLLQPGAYQFREPNYRKLSQTDTFKSYFARHKELRSPSNYKEFLQAMKQAHLNYVHELISNGVEVRFTDHRYMVYIWMHDDADAAFAFHYQGDYQSNTEREITFRTRDAKLIDAFRNIFNLEWEKGKAPPFN